MYGKEAISSLCANNEQMLSNVSYNFLSRYEKVLSMDHFL